MKLDKHELIINAMISLIRRVGTEKVSVSSIAKEAGIGKGSIYYYFETKNDIIDEVAIQTIKRIIEEYYLVTQENNIQVFGKMRLLFKLTTTKTFLDGSENNMHLLFTQSDMYLHQRLNSASMKYMVPVLEKIIIEGIEHSFIKTDNPRKAAELIIMIMLIMFDGELLPTEEQINTVERIKYLSSIIEKNLSAPEGSLQFVADIFTHNFQRS